MPAILASMREKAIETTPVFFFRMHPIAMAAARNTNDKTGYSITVLLSFRALNAHDVKALFIVSH